MTSVRALHRSLALMLVLPTAAALAQSTTPADTSAVSSRQRAHLQPGDVIRLKVWREPDLTGDFIINESGDAVLPRIGALHVVSMSPDSLKTHVISTYTQYLRDPSIEVTFLRRITVLGSVNKPGLYDADETMMLTDVLALAGGVSPDGKRDKVELFRNGQLIVPKLRSDVRLVDSPIQSGDKLYVEEKGFFARNPYVLMSIAGTTIGLIALLSTRH
jgi:protein involved in polysaccharide export with SLBB domain